MELSTKDAQNVMEMASNLGKANARIAALEAALTLTQWQTRKNSYGEIEWVSCPVCHSFKEDGHAKACPVGRALLKGGGK